MPESSEERSRKMKEVWRRARADTGPRRSSTRRSYVKRRKKPIEKIGVVEGAIELGSAVIGAKTALSGDVVGGLVTFGVGMVASKGIKWAAKHSVLHKLGVKIGRRRELVIA